MPKDDDDSWGDDCTPAVEILNYDLNNAGLKQLYEPTEPAKPTKTGSKSAPPKEEEHSARSEDSNISTSEDSKSVSNKRGCNLAKAGQSGTATGESDKPKIMYKIGSLPPPDEDDEREKNIVFEDHIAFLKHASSKSIRSSCGSSMRNMEGAESPVPGKGKNTTTKNTKPPPPLPEDGLEFSDDDDDASQASKSTTSKPTAPSAKPSKGKKKPTAKDDNSDCSDDEIPAVEILNYDLNNIGLKKLNEADSEPAPLKSNPKAAAKPAAKGADPPQKPDPSKPSNEKPASENDDNSECSDDEIPAVEILNYDLNNIGLKQLNERQDEKISNLNPEIAKDEYSEDENESSDSREEEVHPTKPKKQPSNDDGGSDCSDDEIPAVEILNYDLNNIGLKKLNEPDCEQEPKQKAKAKPASKVPADPPPKSSTENVSTTPKKQTPMDDDGSECSDDEIPAVEILNYDLSNIGLKQLNECDDEKNPDPNPATVQEKYEEDEDASSDSTGSGEDIQKIAPAPRAAPSPKEALAPDDDESSSGSELDEIPAIELLNYDLNNAGLKTLYGDGDGDEAGASASKGTKSKNREPKAAQTESNAASPDVVKEDMLASEYSDDEIPAKENVSHDLTNIGLKTLSIKNDDQHITSGPTKLENEKAIQKAQNADDGRCESNSGNKEAIPKSKGNHTLSDASPTKKLLFGDDSSESSDEYNLSKDSKHSLPANLVGRDLSSGSKLNSSESESSRSSKSSLVGKYDCDDHGHFLSIAAEKCKAKQAEEQKKKSSEAEAEALSKDQVSRSLPPSTQNDIAASVNVSSETAGLGLQNIKSNGVDIPGLYSVSPVETTVTTTVVTRTKTVVEPDGTTVTITTITTKTISNANNLGHVAPTASQDCISVHTAASHSVNTSGNIRHTDGTALAIQSSAIGVSTNEEKNISDADCRGACKPLGSQKQTSSAENKDEVNGDSSNNSTRHAPRHVDERSAPVEATSSPSSGNKLRVSVERLDDDSYEGSSDSESEIEESAENKIPRQTELELDVAKRSDEDRSSKAKIDKDNTDTEASNNQKGGNPLINQNESNSRYGSLSPYEKMKSPSLCIPNNKYEDHGDFLSEAASNKSDIDHVKLAEEEKRNDEIAKKKIMSFRVSAENKSPVSPLASPITPGNKPTKSSSRATEKVEHDESESNNSEASEIPAREILNYDLNNLGLMHFQ